LDKTEQVNRQSQQLGGDLRKAGLVTLAARLRSEHQSDAAIRLEADLGAFAGRAARGFEKTSDAEPPQPTAIRGGPPASVKAVGQDSPTHFLEVGGEGSGIDGD